MPLIDKMRTVPPVSQRLKKQLANANRKPVTFAEPAAETIVSARSAVTSAVSVASVKSRVTAWSSAVPSGLNAIELEQTFYS